MVRLLQNQAIVIALDPLIGISSGGALESSIAPNDQSNRRAATVERSVKPQLPTSYQLLA